jgi:conjugative relaxase-like TrwC/TraI family protein
MIASTSVAGAKSYYLEGFSRQDYYTQDQEIVGQWGGKGAQMLGLTGTVNREAFCALCDNLHPATGERLTLRTKANRTVGYDINFHVPKSVSILHTFSKDPRILDAFLAAVDETMRQLETETKTRVRLDGNRDVNRTTGNLTWAGFTHFTARPVDGIPDPHLHAHCYTFNATFDAVENRWKAGQFRDLKADAPYYQAIFHNQLAKKLLALGYSIERRGLSFEIQGVPESLIAKFSRRTKYIEKTAQRLGITTDAAKDKLGAATRELKRKDLTQGELLEIWTAQLSPDEQKALDGLRNVSRHPSREPMPSPAAAGVVSRTPTATSATGRIEPMQGASAEEVAIQYALLHSFEKSSVISERRFLANVLRFGVGEVDVELVKASVATRPDILHREVNGRLVLTTPEVLAEEKAIVAWTKAGANAARPLAPGYAIKTDWLSQEQRAAVAHVLTCTDRVMGVKGKAGTGKTTLMREAVAAMESQGHKVLVLTPGSETAHETLAWDGFAKAQTVAQLLANQSLQKEYQGAVWWIDEAGQLSSRDLYRLTKLAEQHHCRLILSGDTAQHGPVERGDALRILEEHAGLNMVRVDAIQRQTGALREIVEHFSHRRMAEGFQALDGQGRVLEMPNDERHVFLAREYLRLIRSGDTALVISPTHAEGQKVTEAIRQELMAAGDIGKPRTLPVLRQINLSEADRRDARTYRPQWVIEMVKTARGFHSGERLTVLDVHESPLAELTVRREDGSRARLPAHKWGDRFQVYEKDTLPVAVGDRIRFTKNGWAVAQTSRLHNGGLKTVVGFTPDGDVKLDNGVVLPRDYAHLSYGYVTTSHAAQGKTVDHVLIAEGAESFGAASMEQCYVSVSRARKSCLFVTNDKEGLLDAIHATSHRVAALDLMKQDPSAAPDYALELHRAQERAETRFEEAAGQTPLREQLGLSQTPLAMVEEIPKVHEQLRDHAPEGDRDRGFEPGM